MRHFAVLAILGFQSQAVVFKANRVDGNVTITDCKAVDENAAHDELFGVCETVRSTASSLQTAEDMIEILGRIAECLEITDQHKVKCDIAYRFRAMINIDREQCSSAFGYDLGGSLKDLGLMTEDRFYTSAPLKVEDFATPVYVKTVDIQDDVPLDDRCPTVLDQGREIKVVYDPTDVIKPGGVYGQDTVMRAVKIDPQETDNPIFDRVFGTAYLPDRFKPADGQVYFAVNLVKWSPEPESTTTTPPPDDEDETTAERTTPTEANKTTKPAGSTQTQKGAKAGVSAAALALVAIVGAHAL